MFRAPARADLLRTRYVAIAICFAITLPLRAQAQNVLAVETIPTSGGTAPLIGGSSINVPGQDPALLWSSIVDAVDDFYPIERNMPPRRVGGSWQKGQLQSFALLMPSTMTISGPEHRRWLGVSVQPTDTGSRVEVSSYVEVSDALRGADPEASAWRPLGHDIEEEQRIASLLASRLGTIARVFDPVPQQELTSGPLARYPRVERVAGNVMSDAANFYSCRSLATLGVAFGIGAALANTNADTDIRNWYFNGIGYQDGIHGWKYFGEGLYTLPAFAAITLVGTAFEQRPLGGLMQEYGGRGLRTALVGGLPLLFMQEATGGGRPGEHPWGSDWRPFTDNNGVSGHAFIGAIPFITAAKMSERPVLKVFFYGLSIMPGLSRINDSAHYPSQVFLGYTMALVAATAVDNTQHGITRPIIIPFVVGNTAGLGVEFKR